MWSWRYCNTSSLSALVFVPSLPFVVGAERGTTLAGEISMGMEMPLVSRRPKTRLSLGASIPNTQPPCFRWHWGHSASCGDGMNRVPETPAQTRCRHLKQGPWWAHGAAGTWSHAPRGTCDSQNAAAVLPQSHGEPEGHHCTRCSVGLARSRGDSGPRATAGANYRSLTWLDVGLGVSRAKLADGGPLKTRLGSLGRCGISTPQGVKPGLCLGTPGWP